MRKNEKTQSLYQKALEAAPVFIAILGLIGTIINLNITVRIAPLADSINTVSERANAFYATHQNDVNQSQFNLLQSEIKNLNLQMEDVHRYFFGK